jgi:hypothetical protein
MLWLSRWLQSIPWLASSEASEGESFVDLETCASGAACVCVCSEVRVCGADSSEQSEIQPMLWRRPDSEC